MTARAAGPAKRARPRPATTVREDEQRFRGTFEQAAVGVAHVAPDGRFLRVNRRLCEIVGYDRDELLELTFGAITHPDDLDADRARVERLLDGTLATYSLEQRYLRRHGGEVWVHRSVSLVRDAAGRPDYFIAVIEEITARKRIEQSLREREEQLTGLLASAMDAIVSVDRLQRVVLFNAAAERLFGWRRAEVIGQPLDRLLPERARARHRDLLEGFAASGRTTRAEGTLDAIAGRHADGTELALEASISSTGVGDRQLLTAILRDVGERRATAAVLAASLARAQAAEQSLQSLFDNALLGIYRSTLDGRFESVNPALVRMLGYPSREALLHVPVPALYRDAARRADAVARFEAHGERQWIEVEWLRRDGEPILVRLTGRRVGERGAVCYEVFAEDVTERRSLEEQLRHAQRFESLGRLAGGVAHDFNNVLAAILAHGHFLLEELPAVDPRRADAEAIERSVARGAALTRQLLAFSRRQALHPTRLDLGQVVAGLEPSLRRLIGADIDLRVQADADLGAVLVDAGQIEQVLLNLVVNARDAMPAGGALAIATRNVELDGDGTERHLALGPGRYVALAVADTGCGMTAEVRQRIFEPFFTTKGRDGSGLGLATCYGIVRQSGGGLEVDSEVGQGTVFRVYLPRLEKEVLDA